MTRARSGAASTVKASARAPVDLHWGRLSALSLLLIAAAFYVPPLKALFTQQDRHHAAETQFASTTQKNVQLRADVARLQTDAYISEQAREDFQLVPRDVQAFVVKGLPQPSGPASRADDTPTDKPLTVAERVRDLWKILSN